MGQSVCILKWRRHIMTQVLMIEPAKESTLFQRKTLMEQLLEVSWQDLHSYFGKNQNQSMRYAPTLPHMMQTRINTHRSVGLELTRPARLGSMT